MLNEGRMYSLCACHLNLIQVVLEIELSGGCCRQSVPKGLGLAELKRLQIKRPDLEFAP